MLYPPDPEKRDFPSLHESVQPSLVTRILEKGESSLFEIATQMYNTYWPEPLRITPDVFAQWVKNGTVFALFHEGQEETPLVTLACNRLSADQFRDATTYARVTAGGTLENYNERGTILVPFAVTASATKIPETQKALDLKKETALQNLATRLIEEYAHSGRDYILHFHEDPKGGLNRGANVGRILPQSRPEDLLAMGYNITMEYPPLSAGMAIHHSYPAKPSRYVIEEAMTYAVGQDISHIIAFSRPAAFRNHLLSLQG